MNSQPVVSEGPLEDQVVRMCNRMFSGMRFLFAKYTVAKLNTFLLHPM